MEELSQFAGILYIPSSCPFVRSVFLDIISLCGMSMLQRAKDLSTIHAWQDLITSVLIGPQYAIGISKRSGAALLNSSLAHAFFIDRVIVRDHNLDITNATGYQTIGDALTLLAAKDPDTCCTALETLDNILQLENLSNVAIPLSTILAGIYRTVLSSTEPEVVSKAQAVLAGSLMKTDVKSWFFRDVTVKDAMDTLPKLEGQCLDGPPSNMQSGLHLLGFFLDFVFHNYFEHHSITLKAIARYIRLLRMTIIDINPFDTRFAAVQSISALDHVWGTSIASKKTGSLMLALAFVLYDLLNDDDDEVRDVAAFATARFLRAQGHTNAKDTVPILITQHLATFLCTTCVTSPCSAALTHESLRRLTATPSPDPLFAIPFAQTLAAERKEDTALFATEKQNLYKDETLDAVLWSRVLASQPGNLVPREFHEGLANWVLDGLAVLSETALNEVDGSLGWSSKSEVFTLGMRTICAAEVVLKWSVRGSVDGGVVRGKVMQALIAFADAGQKAQVHGLWLERVDRVLEKEVLSTLSRVKEGLVAIRR